MDFVPTLENAVPKDEKHLRFCAQAEDLEDTNALINLQIQFKLCFTFE